MTTQGVFFCGVCVQLDITLAFANLTPMRASNEDDTAESGSEEDDGPIASESLPERVALFVCC